jgi:uncharacterized protein YlxW (UPF0749 family)
LRNAAIIVGIFGLMTAIAFVQTERNAAASEAGREQLITSISQERTALEKRQARIGDLREETLSLSEDVRRVAEAESSAKTNLLGIRGVSGFAPVTGPGVRVKVDDAPDGSANGQVRDEDLALVVDGLWAAGAEAISINGHRLTPLTGIRNVGVAVHIKAQPLKPPYLIEAIGDPDTLQSLYVESSPGSQFMSVANQFGFRLDMDNARTLNLSGSTSPRLRSAQVHQKKKSEKDMEVRP